MNFSRVFLLLVLASSLFSQPGIAQPYSERVQELLDKIRHRPDEALPDLCRAARWVKEEMTPALVEAAGDETWQQRSRALRVLTELGQFQALPQFIKNPSHDLRLAALDGLLRAPRDALDAAMSDIAALYQESLITRGSASGSESLLRQRAASALLRSSQSSDWILLWRHEPGLREAIRQRLQEDSTSAAAAIFKDCHSAPSPDSELLLEFSRLASSEQLLEALLSTTPLLQLAALNGLAARARPLAPGQALPEAISSALKAEDPELRAAAILACFRLTASISAAREGLRDADLRVRRAALGTMLLSGSACAEHRSLIASFLDSDDLDSVLRAAACLISLDGLCPEKAIPALAQGLQREFEIRKTSLAAINLAAPLCIRFRTELRKNLEHEEAPIRALAAQALLQITELSDAETSALESALECESDRFSRAALLPLVKRVDNERAAALLLQQGLNHPDPALQAFACSLATELPDFRLVEARILELSVAPSQEPRIQALQALALAPGLSEPGLRRLLAALTEPDAAARKLASHGLGRLGLPLAEDIINLARSGERLERSAALLTISRLGIGLAVVITTSHEKDKDLRSIACFALSAYSEPAARKRLAELAQADPEAKIRELAKNLLLQELPTSPDRKP